MRSKTSFFNPGLSRSLLRRSWPIWTSYFVLLLIMVPGSLMNLMQSSYYRRTENAEYLFRELNRNMLNCGVNVAVLSFFVCVLVAMAMFGYMYNSRSCSMYNSLPMKRETVFSTAFLTGLIPMLMADLVIALICLAFFTGEGQVEAVNVWLFLAMALMGNIAFFGFAAFCAVLTGNLFILPAVYVVLNVAVTLAEGGIRTAFDTLVYGASYWGFRLTGFSPIAKLIESLNVQAQYQRLADGSMQETGEFILNGMGWLAIYCVAGVVFAALALFIYRRRQMETCGDVVSIPILKPIFKYCMCFGVSLMFAYVVYNALFADFLISTAEAGAYLALMLAGAFIGYFVAEMLMQKTLRVFRGRWKGFIVSCAVIAAFVGILEFDLTGYERRVPELDALESVSISYYEGSDFSQEANIDAVRAFHQQLIDEKQLHERAVDGSSLEISYELKDGSQFMRRYRVSFDIEQKRDDGSAVNVLARLVNLQEAIDNRLKLLVPLTRFNVLDSYFHGPRLLENGETDYFNYPLTPEQALEFYNECILPDGRDGKVSRVFPVENEEYYNNATPISFGFSVYNDESDLEEWYRSYHEFTIYLDAERCCDWIEANTDIELISMGELDPEGMEARLRELGLDF